LSAGDELLRWVSEVGSGSWEQLRDACAFVTQKHSVRRRPWELANEVSALGHLDIDWKSRSWSISPPTLNLVPGLGLCLVLTGSRPYYFDQRIEKATDDPQVFPFAIPQPPAPAARFVKCESIEVAQRVAERAGVQLVIDPTMQLAQALQPVDDVPIDVAPEPPIEEASRFNPKSLTWEGADHRLPGLYRVDLHGRLVHRRLDEYGNWSEIDLAVGQFLALRERKEPVVRWRPPRDGAPAQFEVRKELALPLIAERALTLCSGLVPKVEGCWRRYLNVDREIAERIADALLQPLTTPGGP
jgi:hypothetical protein